MATTAPERELLKRFEVQKFLGKGSYGSVYRVRRLSDDKVYALKETNVRNLSQTERQEAVNEIRLLASVQQNAAISGFHEAFIDGNRLCIVMEYAPFGDLSRALRKRQAQKKLLPEDLIWSYFIQITRGLQALHAQKILHRDVKTANVLRMSGEIVKLGDLGIAKLMKGAMTHTQIGTPHYMPPEVWRNRPYTFNSDVWALGCVLFEMCTFVVPFEARSMEELRFKVMKGKFPALPAVYSQDMQKMVRWLMIAEPSQRPDINQVLDHPSVRRRAHLAPEPEPLRGPDSSVDLCLDAKGQQGEHDSGTAVTLGTIKVPKNLKMLKQRLPAPSYPSDHEKLLKENSERAEREKKRAQSGLPSVAGTETENGSESKASESKAADVVKSGGVAAARAAVAAPSARDPVARAHNAPFAGGSNAVNARAVGVAHAAKGVLDRAKSNPSVNSADADWEVPPLHKPGAKSENNLGNGYGARLVQAGPSGAVAASSARDRAYAASERLRLDRERASEIRAEAHRERSAEDCKKPAAEPSTKSDYAAAPSRVKLPLISGNGAVECRVNRNANAGGAAYAPAAPLPLNRNGFGNGQRPLPVFGKGESKKENEENGVDGVVGKNAVGLQNVDKRRVGLTNLSNLDNRPAARGVGVPVRQAPRRPAPMARNFYF